MAALTSGPKRKVSGSRMPLALEQLYDDFDAGLRRFVSGRVSDPLVVDDLLQEVYLRIHQHLHSLQDATRLKSWVYQITRNTLIDYYRRRRDVEPLPDTLAAEADTDDNTAARELAGSLRGLLACLPASDQEALRLTEFEGLRQRELAARLGLSLSGAKSRVQRAREKLKAALLDCCQVELDRRRRVLAFQPHCLSCLDEPQAVACAAPEVLEPVH